MSGALQVRARRPDTNQLVELTLSNMHLFSYGVYANVYIGTLADGKEERTVAVKKCWNSTDDLREVRILRMLNRFRHKNIVNLLYMFQNSHDGKVCFSLVMNFMPQSLSAYIKKRRPHPLALIDAKLFGWQMFRGLHYLHRYRIIHRDLKPQNILLEPESGLIQVADFGSSAIIGEQMHLSSYHVTRYYRPPELLLGSQMYGCEIDVWSAGCVFADMLRGRTLFAGSTTDDQFFKIAAALGPPNDNELRVMHAQKMELLAAEDYKEAVRKFQKRGPAMSGMREMLPNAPAKGVRLLEQIMVYDPFKRLAGPKLLGDKFFEELFEQGTQRNGRPLSVVTRADLLFAVGGDFSQEEQESHTGPAPTDSH